MPRPLKYYSKGHDCKMGADYGHVDQESESHEDTDIITVQVATGF